MPRNYYHEFVKGIFSKIAKQYSIDSTKDKGGDLGWVTADSLVKDFSDAAFKLRRKGQVSGVVKSPYGFHIIQFNGSKTRPASKFEDVKESIYQRLYNQERENRFQTVLDTAKNTFQVS